MGTPIATQAPTMTTKNRIRLPRPIAISSGSASHSVSATMPTVARAASKARGPADSISRSRAMIAAMTPPTRIAATRQASEMFSVVSSV